MRLARVSGLAVQRRDKRNGEPGAVFLDLVLQHDSINHGRRLALAGGMDKEFLRREARKFAPWLRALGLANGALAMIMAVWIAEGHTILAALIAFLGIVIGVTALTLKPAMDRAAIYGSNR